MTEKVPLEDIPEYSELDDEFDNASLDEDTDHVVLDLDSDPLLLIEEKTREQDYQIETKRSGVNYLILLYFLTLGQLGLFQTKTCFSIFGLVGFSFSSSYRSSRCSTKYLLVSLSNFLFAKTNESFFFKKISLLKLVVLLTTSEN